MKRVFLRDLDFNKLAASIGFTKTEAKVILFLALSFIVGMVYSNINSNTAIYREYDYKTQDSLFYAAGSDEDDTLNNYKSEFIDTSKKFSNRPVKITPGENSIDINHAELSQLMMLPGIGEKTAQNIIDYKNKNGDFRTLHDILNVKGIGEVKLAKIKKYIYIK